MAYDFHFPDAAIATIISIAIATVFIKFAAGIVLDRGGWIASLLVAVLGSILAGIVAGLIGSVWGLILAVLAWGLVAGIFFRTSVLRGVAIGVVAWFLWFLVRLVVNAVFG